jgi:hypothetical protein
VPPLTYETYSINHLFLVKEFPYPNGTPGTPSPGTSPGSSSTGGVGGSSSGSSGGLGSGIL